MKYRPQRELLEESMREVMEFDSTEQFASYIKYWWDRTMFSQGLEKIEVRPYAPWTWPDTRIGWNKTYIVTANGMAIGFTDGPLPG